MLDTSTRRRSFADRADDPPEPWRDGLGLKLALAKVRHCAPLLVRLMLFGAVIGGVGGIGYSVVKVPVFSASAELLISNTTLQMSGPDAVVTQILVENSLIQSAIEMLGSGRVLGRVIDKIGLDTTEAMLPRSSLKQAFDWTGWRHVRDFLRQPISASEQRQANERRRQDVLARLRADTTVARRGASLVISVRARSHDADDAARLTNELAASFVQEQNDISAVVSTSAALRERIKVLGPTARIISDAVPPTASDGPPKAAVMVLAPAVGGALALAFGIGLALFDRRLRSVEQLVALTSVECFGSLPRTEAPQADQFRQALTLRRAILQRARLAVLEGSSRAPHFVGVTSYRRGEGKTTLAGSWAWFLARQGSRVLLVDAGDGEPSAGVGAGEARLPGLHELLRGDATSGDAIRRDISPNLDFLPSGNVAGNLDTLWGNLVCAINAEGECAYEWVILDLPALATAADVRSAGRVLDDLLIVVEWGRTSEAELNQALGALGAVRDRILGTVINKEPRVLLHSEISVRMQAARRALAALRAYPVSNVSVALRQFLLQGIKRRKRS